MNKVVWRFLKLSGAILLVYISVIQIVYRIRQDSSKVPFKMVQPGRVGLVATAGVEKLSGVRNSTVPTTKAERVEKVSREVENGPPWRKVVNTLLHKPQQDADFYHNVKTSSAIWPAVDHPEDDRIISQMMYGLPDLPPTTKRVPKKILVYSGLKDGMQRGSKSFDRQKCPVRECELTSDRSAARDADVILWQHHISLPSVPRPPGQIWMVFFLESPYHTPSLGSLRNKVNWTSTYRRDSTIVAPYERFTLYNSSVTQLPQVINYAKGKTKKVAWFVSNCGARNNRLEYAKELGKHIEVDIFGACGSKSCPRYSSNCFNLLSTTYKFYLAFENSNCRDYITEKFFVNGLKNDVIPIVMGAHPDDYKRAAPKNSYIHVDDFESPKHLAEYLHQLDKDDKKYNEYFKWKGTGDNVNTYFWCRLCAMAHAANITSYQHTFDDVNNWWRGPSVCRERFGNNLWPKW